MVFRIRDIVMWCYVFFFFFQAEDGIRDYKVTGVQTCALPISAPRRVPPWRGRRRRLRGRQGSGRDHRLPRLVRRSRLRGVRAVRAGPCLRARRPARLGARRVRARPHDTRCPPAVRGSRDPGTDLSAARRVVRGERAARQSARLLRTIRGPVEERGSRVTAVRARREESAGETQRRRGALITPCRVVPRTSRPARARPPSAPPGSYAFSRPETPPAALPAHPPRAARASPPSAR